MATNEILRFAETNTGTNLLTQSEYAADSQRPIGNQPGVARSKLVNKALRQASLIAAGLAEYIADNQANNITDALTPQNIADYLQAAITGALGVTPPQFDNDTSLATTAFVQRALGNRSGDFVFTTSQTLTAAHAGAVVRYDGTGGHTFTLPNPSSVPAGTSILVFCNNARSLTVTTPSGVIGGAVNPSAASILLNAGTQYEFISGGGNWRALNGSGQASLLSSGYQKLPSGLIIQWGSNAGASVAVLGQRIDAFTFPVAFPNAVLLVTGNAQSNGGSFVSGWVRTASITLTGCAINVFNDSGTGAGAQAIGSHYFAIGY